MNSVRTPSGELRGMARARVTSKGQITIPKDIRERLGVGPGDMLEFLAEGDRLEVRPLRRRRLQEFRGLFRVPEVLPFEQERTRAWAAQTRRLTKRRRERHG